MSDEQIKINELRAQYGGHGSMLVKDWNKEIISGNDQWGFFLYWNPWENKSGFEAVLVQCMSRGVLEAVEETHVEVVFHLSAFYDGGRHMYFNIYDKDADSRGYIYYPDIPAMIKALQFVEKLQQEHCEHYE